LSHVSLKYGSTVVSADLVARTLSTSTLPDLPAPVEEIRRALASPIGTAPLDKVVSPGERVVIVTSDITRYTGSEIYLPILVDELNNYGIPDDDIEVIIALGIHRKQTQAEHKKSLARFTAASMFMTTNATTGKSWWTWG